MNDDAAEAQKARVMAEYERWRGPLGLGYQREVSFRWHRGPIPGHDEAALVCLSQWKYKATAIDVDLTQVDKLTDADLEFALVHELMHIFMAGLIEAFNARVDGDAFRMIEEHTATTLAQAVMWLRSHCESQEVA